MKGFFEQVFDDACNEVNSEEETSKLYQRFVRVSEVNAESSQKNDDAWNSLIGQIEISTRKKPA